MRDAITKRRSIRAYTGEPLRGADHALVQRKIDDINSRSGLHIEIVEDGSDAFNGMLKSYGIFKNVCTVILLKGPTDLEDLPEKTGYYGEELILDLVDMGLGTCWVGGTYDSRSYDIPKSEKLVAVVPVGYISDNPSMIGRIMVRGHTKRKPLEERIKSDVTPLPDWIRKGMEAVIPAPSAVNSQKPHFDYTGGVLTASVKHISFLDLVDLGIAKYHFVCEAGGQFDFGNGGKYHK